MNTKIEQELNFVVDDSRLFFDAQEAKKVSVTLIRKVTVRSFQMALPMGI